MSIFCVSAQACAVQTAPFPPSLNSVQASPRAQISVLVLALLCSSSWTSLTHAQTPTLAPVIVTPERGKSLTVPDLQTAQKTFEQTAGGVALVPESAWHDTKAATVKDMLDYTPGVFAQPKWGDDARLSIRGSGLSRYYHLRGISLYQDGIPLNDPDGSSNFHRIDPTVYRYTEVYKGANALQYGAATLGGAINFVTPTGHDADAFQGRLDAGSFGWRRVQLSSGFAGEKLDGVISGSWQTQDGYREQSTGHSSRASANLGWRLSDRAETRFYLSGYQIHQDIPGSVSRDQALNKPRQATKENKEHDWQLNLDGGRIANRTVLLMGETQYELGGWFEQSSLRHPIYQFIDRDTTSYGAYGKLVNTSPLAGIIDTSPVPALQTTQRPPRPCSNQVPDDLSLPVCRSSIEPTFLYIAKKNCHAHQITTIDLCIPDKHPTAVNKSDEHSARGESPTLSFISLRNKEFL